MSPNQRRRHKPWNGRCNTLGKLFVINIMTLTVRLPETIESQLARFCETMGLSKSQVVQTALKEWFAKPTPSSNHPLLAFAQAAAQAAPSADWAGPYSKENLRARVLAGAGAHRACEPAATYLLPKKKPVSRRKSPVKLADADSSTQNNSNQLISNKASGGIILVAAKLDSCSGDAP